MRRFICAILCIMMLASLLLTGCNEAGKTTDPAATKAAADAAETTAQAAVAGDDGKKEFENKSLDVYAFDAGFGSKYFDAVITGFKKDYPGTEIKLTASPQIQDMVRPMFLAGNPPDFYVTSMPEKYGLEGALLELNDVFDGKALDRDVPLKELYPDGLLDYCMPLKDGKIYYAYDTVGVQGLWYNKTYFESKGWTAPGTVDEFFALGDKAKAEGKSLYTYQGIYPGYNQQVLWGMIYSTAGPEALKKIGNYEEGAWADPNVKKCLQFFADIAAKGYLMPGTTALNHTQAQTDFLNGKALFIPNGTWFKNEMQDAIPKEGFSFGFMAIPVFNAGDRQCVSGGGGAYYLIPKQGKNPELAKEFLRYQYTEMSCKLMAGLNGGITAIKGAVEMAKPYIDPSIYEAFKVIDNGVTPVSADLFTPVANTTIVITDEIFNPMSSVMNNKMTVDEWVQRIEKATVQIRKDMGK